MRITINRGRSSDKRYKVMEDFGVIWIDADKPKTVRLILERSHSHQLRLSWAIAYSSQYKSSIRLPSMESREFLQKAIVDILCDLIEYRILKGEGVEMVVAQGNSVLKGSRSALLYFSDHHRFNDLKSLVSRIGRVAR